MNVYGVQTDGEMRYHLANQAAKSIEIDYEIFRKENDDWISRGKLSEQDARNYYESILEQVVLVAEIYQADQS